MKNGRDISEGGLRGSIPPVITPFKSGEVDYDTYKKLIEFQLQEGTHGILVNGTTAEPSTLTLEERNMLVTTAKETVDSVAEKSALEHNPFLVAATGSQSLAETKVLTRHAAEVGVDTLLIVTPYYIKPPQRGLIEYYLKVMEGIDIPWMIYHIPGRTAVSITMDTVQKLKLLSPNFVGMKHAVNDLGFVSELLGAYSDFRIFVGLEELSFPMMAVGAVGLMNAVGNLCPGVLSKMCQAVWDNDLMLARKYHQNLLEINQAVFYDTNPIPMKYMMKKMGLIPNNEHRLPMSPATPELEKRLDKVLEAAGLLK